MFDQREVDNNHISNILFSFAYCCALLAWVNANANLFIMMYHLIFFADISIIEIRLNATAAPSFINDIYYHIHPDCLSNHFKSVQEGNKWSLFLQKAIDVEYIYLVEVSHHRHKFSENFKN